jgi:hypothetical protein
LLLFVLFTHFQTNNQTQTKQTVSIETMQIISVSLPEDVEWIPDFSSLPFPSNSSNYAILKHWPKDFEQKWRENIYQLDGEKPLKFPISNKTVILKRKSCVQKDSQLDEMMNFFTEYYQQLGLFVVGFPVFSFHGKE